MSEICGFHNVNGDPVDTINVGHDHGVDVLGTDFVIGALPRTRPPGKFPYGPPVKVKGPKATQTTAKAKKNAKQLKSTLAKVANRLKSNKKTVEKVASKIVARPISTGPKKLITKVKGFEGDDINVLGYFSEKAIADALDGEHYSFGGHDVYVGATATSAKLTAKQRGALDKQKRAAAKAASAAKKADEAGKKLFNNTRSAIAKIKTQAAKLKAARKKRTTVRGDVVGIYEEILGNQMMEILSGYDVYVGADDDNSIVDPTTGETVDLGLPADGPRMISFTRESNKQGYDAVPVTTMPPNAVPYNGAKYPGYIGSYGYFWGTTRQGNGDEFGYVFGGDRSRPDWPGEDPSQWVHVHGRKGHKDWWNHESADKALLSPMQNDASEHGGPGNLQYGPLIGNTADEKTAGLKVDSAGNVFWLREDAPEWAVAEEKYAAELYAQEQAAIEAQEQAALQAEQEAEEAARQKEIADQEAQQALEMDQAQHEADIAAVQQQTTDTATQSQQAANQAQYDLDAQRMQMELVKQQQEFQMEQARQQAEIQKQWMDQQSLLVQQQAANPEMYQTQDYQPYDTSQDSGLFDPNTAYGGGDQRVEDLNDAFDQMTDQTQYEDGGFGIDPSYDPNYSDSESDYFNDWS